jgi:hypothetical protein
MSYKVRVIKSASKGVERFDNEANDCTVRALANAYGMPYKLAHRIMAKQGRKPKAGLHPLETHKALTRLGFTLQGVYGTTKKARFLARVLECQPKAGTTLASLLSSIGLGRYVVTIRGHALAIVNGEVLDYGNNLANSHVATVYKLPEQHLLFNQ